MTASFEWFVPSYQRPQACTPFSTYFCPGPSSGVLKAPDLLREDTDCREGVEKDGHLWHRLDTSFRQPRAYSQIVLGTPVVREQGAQASVHAGIMADILSTVPIFPIYLI